MELHRAISVCRTREATAPAFAPPPKCRLILSAPSDANAEGPMGRIPVGSNVLPHHLLEQEGVGPFCGDRGFLTIVKELDSEKVLLIQELLSTETFAPVQKILCFPQGSHWQNSLYI